MQPLATAEQMHAADKGAIRALGVPGLVLMENAGRAFVDILEASAGPLAGMSVFILCGKGKNGGDGFVIARHLAIRGAGVSVFLLGRMNEIRGDARVNLKSLLRLAAKDKTMLRFSSGSSLRSLSRNTRPDIIVDALLGTGFSGSVRGVYKKGIDWINASGARVFSVDIPSGVDASSGSVSGSGQSALKRPWRWALGKPGSMLVMEGSMPGLFRLLTSVCLLTFLRHLAIRYSG